MGDHVETDPYSPAEYWDERLSRDYSLRGTGHIAYSDGYNNWLYRRKGDVLSTALDNCPQSGHALDIGSGTGWIVEQLLGRGFNVDGCDISPVAVTALSDRFSGSRFFELAIGSQPIPRPDDSFDLITVMDVLYHVTSDPHWNDALLELARLLRPGGRIVVTDAFCSAPHSPATHVLFRSEQQWRTALAASNLAIESLLPLYSWLSRDREEGRLARLPGRLRGPLEYALERIGPRDPHLRCAVLMQAE